MDHPSQQTQIAPTSGLKLASLTWNSGPSKLEIICLHGWMDNAKSFSPLAGALTEYQVQALELPGHGQSEHLPEAAFYHFQDYLRIIFDLLEAKESDYILMGHSLGAAIASLIAGYLGPKLKKLILIEGIGPLTANDEEAGDQLGKHLVAGTMPRKQYKPISEDSLTTLITTRANVGGLTRDHARLLVKRNISIYDNVLTWRSDPRIKHPSATRLTEAQVISILGKVKVDSLLITGDKGILKPDILERRCKALQGSLEKQVIKGGHHLHMENPKAVAKAISEFLG